MKSVTVLRKTRHINIHIYGSSFTHITVSELLCGGVRQHLNKHQTLIMQTTKKRAMRIVNNVDFRKHENALKFMDVVEFKDTNNVQSKKEFTSWQHTNMFLDREEDYNLRGTFNV